MTEKVPGVQTDTNVTPPVTPDATSGPSETPNDTPAALASPSASDTTSAQTSQPQSMEEAIALAFDGTALPTAPAAVAQEDATEDTPAPGADDEAKTNTDPTKTPVDPADADVTDAGEDPSEEELAALRPGAQKRVKQLLSQRNTARREATTLKPMADGYQAVRSFMTRNDLDDAEVATLFQAGADLKSGDPARLKQFLATIEPFVVVAREALGLSVPSDLQPQVDNGEMTEQAANQVAMSRRQAEMATARADRIAQGQEADTRSRAQATTQGGISAAIRDWTVAKVASDPEFVQKQAVMTRITQALVAERGLPKTPQEATRYADDAYREASTLLRPAARPATRPSPSASAASTQSGVNPAPQSLEDVITAGLKFAG
jgi:hypothetical protein